MAVYKKSKEISKSKNEFLFLFDRSFMLIKRFLNRFKNILVR